MIIVSYIVWLLLSRLIKYLPHFIKRPHDVLALPVWIVFNIYFALMKVYCLFTLHVTEWGTRAGADGNDNQSEDMDIYVIKEEIIDRTRSSGGKRDNGSRNDVAVEKADVTRVMVEVDKKESTGIRTGNEDRRQQPPAMLLSPLSPRSAANDAKRSADLKSSASKNPSGDLKSSGARDHADDLKSSSSRKRSLDVKSSSSGGKKSLDAKSSSSSGGKKSMDAKSSSSSGGKKTVVRSSPPPLPAGMLLSPLREVARPLPDVPK